MRSSAAKIKLTSVDDLFSSEESRADASRERVVELPLAEMHPFKNHPFKVLDDEKIAVYSKQHFSAKKKAQSSQCLPVISANGF